MSRFTNTLIILTFVIHNCISLIEKHKEHFIVEDYPLNDTMDCVPTTKEQFYINIRNDNETYLTKAECMPENLEINNYFPKCCPPNQIYHVKYHKCIESNLTNIYDDFGDGSLLIRSDLSDCKVILDHVLNNQTNFLINFDRSLNFQNKFYKLGSYCLDNAYGDGNFVVRTCEDVSVCKDNGVRCLKKCCPDGQFYKGSTCQSGHDFGISLKDMTRYQSKNEDFNAVLISESCSRYMDKTNLKFHITEDGTTVIRELGVWTQYNIEETYHCVEYIQRVKDYKLLLCKIPPHVQNPVRVMLKRIAMSISCICLLLTLFGYIFIPDLKNLVGKIIVCYCSCLMIAFGSLTYLQFDKTTRGDYCDVFGFVVAFFFLAAFSWMTIMSYEMWRVLGSMNTQYTGKAHTHKKRFILYNIIGWSIPMIIIIFTLFDYWYYFLPNALHITVGYVGCVFENNRSRGMYGYIFHFGIPCGIYLLTNFVIFVKTIRYIYQVKNQIQAIKIQDGQEKRKKWMILNTDKERLKMVIRIFLVMGVNFSFEVFSSIIGFNGNTVLEHVELIFDAFNGLQGMFIFCIFLMKKKIWKSLREKMNLAGSRSSMATCSTEEMMIQRH